MILRRASRPCPISSIGHSVDGLPKDTIEEKDIIGHHSRSQVVRKVVATTYHSIDVLVRIGHDQLERTK